MIQCVKETENINCKGYIYNSLLDYLVKLSELWKLSYMAPYSERWLWIKYLEGREMVYLKLHYEQIRMAYSEHSFVAIVIIAACSVTMVGDREKARKCKNICFVKNYLFRLPCQGQICVLMEVGLWPGLEVVCTGRLRPRWTSRVAVP
jgi:hypothetical protein